MSSSRKSVETRLSSSASRVVGSLSARPLRARSVFRSSWSRLAIAVGLARAEADALDRKLRDGRPQPSLAGQTVLLVDDGLATGATMIAAARCAGERGAGRIVAAAPVGARETVDLLRREADEVVCPYAVDDLVAVGLWYADFPQVDDEDVAELLRTFHGSAR